MDATGLAARLDLDLGTLGICHACLCFVAGALAESGDERAVNAAISRFAPDLWAEGLALPVRAALERARKQGDRDADAAIADVERRGARSILVRAIVRRLAEDMLSQARDELERRSPAAAVLSLRGSP